MSQPKPRIAIIGLGQVGASIGLALRQAGVASAVVGHDKRIDVNGQAKKLGAVDETEWRLLPAVEKADLVILAIPLDGIRDTLRVIGPELRDGCVVLDTAALKVPVMQWADELLPDHVHFVGCDPIITQPTGPSRGTESARADLFQNGAFCLCLPSKTDSAAVKLATDLVMLLGAKPIFYDAVEHDGLLAAVDQLPRLLSLALVETVTRPSTWREIRRLAGPVFESGSALTEVDPQHQSELCQTNRVNLLRWMDSLSASLDSLRSALAGESGEDLAKRFEAAKKERDKWLSDRAQGVWDESQQANPIPRQGIMDSFLGGYLSKKLRQEPVPKKRGR